MKAVFFLILLQVFSPYVLLRAEEMDEANVGKVKTKQYVIKPSVLGTQQYLEALNEGTLIGSEEVVAVKKESIDVKNQGIFDHESFRVTEQAATKKSRDALISFSRQILNPVRIKEVSGKAPEKGTDLQILESHPEIAYSKFRDCAMRATTLIKSYVGSLKNGEKISLQKFQLQMSDLRLQSYSALLKGEMLCSQYLPSPLKINGRTSHNFLLEEAIVLSTLARFNSFENAKSAFVPLYAIYGSRRSEKNQDAWIQYWKHLSLLVIFNSLGKLPLLENNDLKLEAREIEEKYLKI